MQLEILVKQAKGLKHDGRHSVEFLLDNHAPQRTRWVDDLYDTQGLVVQPKNFHSSKCTITLRADMSAYKDSFLHLTLFHQRNIRDDKRAAEAHLPFSSVEKGFKGWVGLEHKDKYGGQLYIEASLKEVASTPVPPKDVPVPAPNDSEIAEQMAILASIQASRSQPVQGRPVPESARPNRQESPVSGSSWPWPDSHSSQATPSGGFPEHSWPDWPGATAAPRPALELPPST